MSYSCHRCKKQSSDLRTSMFNIEKICRFCQNLEIEDPLFEKARDAVIDAISKGDYKFDGIGLPDSLKR